MNMKIALSFVVCIVFHFVTFEVKSYKFMKWQGESITIGVNYGPEVSMLFVVD